MKNKLLFFMTGSFVLSCLVSFSQPVLTATGINPVIGESFTLYGSAYISPGGSGPGQTWDFSSMSATANDLTNFVAPSSAPSGSSFPSANIAGYVPSAGTAVYYNTSSSALQNYGTAGTTLIPYSNPEDIIHFPFTYLNTFTDTWTAQYQNGTYIYHRKGTTTVTAEGFGTLITPNGTYANVLRLHLVQDYLDSTFAGGPFIINYYNDEYIWFKEGVHHQVASIYSLTTSSGGPYTGASYSSGSTGIEENMGLINDCILYPDPVNDIFNVGLTLAENQQIEFNIFNILGQQVKESKIEYFSQGSNSAEFDVAELQEGMYIMQMQLNDKSTINKHFIISR